MTLKILDNSIIQPSSVQIPYVPATLSSSFHSSSPFHPWDHDFFIWKYCYLHNLNSSWISLVFILNQHNMNRLGKKGVSIGYTEGNLLILTEKARRIRKNLKFIMRIFCNHIYKFLFHLDFISGFLDLVHCQADLQ